jgi:hypothetical protein
MAEIATKKYIDRGHIRFQILWLDYENNQAHMLETGSLRFEENGVDFTGTRVRRSLEWRVKSRGTE